MRFARDAHEAQHIMRNTPVLHERVQILYHDYAVLEGVVIAASRRRGTHRPWVQGCCFTVRTDDDRHLEIDVLDVCSVRHLNLDAA